jgi:tetraacyldisaccharide 4'-kinase
MQAWFESQWQKNGAAQLVLRPLSWLFLWLTWLRKQCYQRGIFRSYALPVPVVVVGNVTVGGTGKTPLVILLAEQLQSVGFRPGIVSRGYGGTHTGEVLPTSHPNHFGDEPVLIAKRTQRPVFVDPDRVAAAHALLKAYPTCNLIISDDGLQHYRLKRDIEIVVINTQYSLGNQQLLPAGPLREPLYRLQQVMAIVDAGRGAGVQQRPSQAMWPPVYAMSLVMQGIFSLDDTRKISLSELQQQPVVAIAGIGHPVRFFSFVKGLGLHCDYRAFNDHHVFTQADFIDLQDKTILMTEKDAVKCRHLTLNNAWYLPVSAMLATEVSQPALTQLIVKQLNAH